ncbi:MAG: copper chaperone PCu(A)C [Zoogloeaceae bacterium]|nr:copper chaperone PCu(A)C [Rhodocyclaceae bacterium]MCP5236596.1 copper chaperone PCu(A)C [Zoogloeaceae bacterium]
MNRYVNAIAIGLVVCGIARAEVTVSDAWVRASLPQQRATGAFMKIHSNGERLRLVGAESAVAGVAEIHEMRIENDIARMGPVAGVDIVPGATVELRPGGYHVMLMDLHRALEAGTEVPLVLVFEGAGGEPRRVPVTASVKPLNTRVGGHRQ